jgi:hypothetical protein
LFPAGIEEESVVVVMVVTLAAGLFFACPSSGTTTTMSSSCAEDAKLPSADPSERMPTASLLFTWLLELPAAAEMAAMAPIRGSILLPQHFSEFLLAMAGTSSPELDTKKSKGFYNV